MATIYTTRQGETVDIACMRHYGRTSTVTELVLDANRGIATNVILPIGTHIVMPDFDVKTADVKLVSLWD